MVQPKGLVVKALTKLELIAAAVTQSQELTYQMTLFDVEYHPELVRSLVREYDWTSMRIVTLCEESLDDDQLPIDDQIAINKILEQYKEIRRKAKL